MEPIKVLILDDKEIPREALARLLDAQESIEVVSRCSNIAHSIEEVERTAPDLVLVDSRLSECDGNEAARRINDSDPRVKVAVLTDSKEKENVFSAIESGATGYLYKETPLDTFIESIQIIGKGGMVLSSQVAEKLGDKLSTRPEQKAGKNSSLTEQEIAVVKLLTSGATNKEVAKALFISDHTAKVHTRNILWKLGLRNRQQVAAYAVQTGIVTEINDNQ